MIACVMIPYFATTLARQARKDEDSSLIVVQYRGGRGRILAADARAVETGVSMGMTITRARALCPEATVALFQPSLIRRAITDLLETLSQFSQYLEWERGGIQTAVYLLDLGRLKPSVGVSLGEQMVQAAAEMGFTASIGLAATPFTARIAALNAPSSGVKLIHQEETQSFLTQQPAALLPASKETARRLALFGLRRMGQIADLPRTALIGQFGKEGGRLHRCACGQDGRRIARYIPPEIARAVRVFEPPIDDALIIQSILNALAAELMGMLIASERTCGEVILTLKLDDQSEHETIQRPREPLAQRIDLARVLHRLLSEQKLHAPIAQISVQIGRFALVKPRQLSLFDEDKPATPHDLLRDLSARYGETLFYSVVTGQTQSLLPERRFLLEALDTDAAA